MKRHMFSLSIVAMSLVIMAKTMAEEKPRAQSASGFVSKIDGSALTIVQRGDSGERSTTFALGAQTKVLLQTKDDDVVKGEGGRERKVPKTKEGTIADVKVGERVTVGFAEAGKAESILVLRATPPRKNEGEK